MFSSATDIRPAAFMIEHFVFQHLCARDSRAVSSKAADRVFVRIHVLSNSYHVQRQRCFQEMEKARTRLPELARNEHAVVVALCPYFLTCWFYTVRTYRSPSFTQRC
jgi:hypothetical protein